MIRECQPAGHYNKDQGEKWSSNDTITCEGEGTRQDPCSGIYTSWQPWTDCNKSCVHKDEQSIRVRQRDCNDTIIESGKLQN